MKASDFLKKIEQDREYQKEKEKQEEKKTTNKSENCTAVGQPR